MTTRALGVVAAVFYAAHTAEVVWRWPAANVLWACNVGSLAVALGLLLEAPLPVAVGAILLAVGDGIWIISLFTGAENPVTSPLIHVGSPALALVGLWRIGLPREAWWASALVLAAATLAAHLFSPAAENIDFAHRIPPGWEWRWPSHGAYLAFLGSACTACAAAMQGALRWLGFRAPGEVQAMRATRAHGEGGPA